MAVREALSAQLDGEQQIINNDLIATHCETCTDCHRWRNHVHALHRQVRVAPAPAVPNLTSSIMQAIDGMPSPAAARQRTLQTCRVLLACCAGLQLLITLPVLFGNGGGPVHLDHELGSWDLALSAGLLFAAFRPERAWGMLPLVGAVALALGTTAVIDVASGHTDIEGESSHLLEAIGVLFLWNIARLNPSNHTKPRAVQAQIHLA